MSNLTIVCEQCNQSIDGLIDAATTRHGDPIIMSGGFQLFDDGAYCDGCMEERND